MCPHTASAVSDARRTRILHGTVYVTGFGREATRRRSGMYCAETDFPESPAWDAEERESTESGSLKFELNVADVSLMGNPWVDRARSRWSDEFYSLVPRAAARSEQRTQRMPIDCHNTD